ncbi:hypothetical protein GUJ93_ZPchr0006g44970 [Zizania palustris]|uniref:Uncharacterized protein n=1 Tax=Zizania palustris TaxID=103762 RepID=A0A8J5SY91_ZIZPA|nr:hypothetical protein GUJ93_ZPchr0006g44970 [Zizania palustris]
MAAVATGAGKRKRSFSEDDVYLILHRYTPATILTALQEVGQHVEKGRRIDWRALVRKTATGITSAREYQMLWRHFAYNHELSDSVGAGAQPLDDESDLECDIEPVPAPGNEALAEATAFAKTIIFGSSREQASGQRVNSEAPTLNTPNEKIVRVPSDKQLVPSHRLTNGTSPVYNSKQLSNTGSSPDPLDPNGPPKKKKKTKPWSKEEDMELAVGVQKYGEGNWLDILHKCKFDSARTHVQLSQRWIFICKRQGSTKLANPKTVSAAASTEERKAAQKAFSMALDMPMTGLPTLRSGGLQQSIQHHTPMFAMATPEVKSVTVPSPLPVPMPVTMPIVPVPVPVQPVQVQLPPPQLQQAPTQAAPPKVSNTSNKSRNNSKKQVPQPSPVNGPSSIQAAAIAAGGRIATPSVATNLLKAAQSTKAVHIRSRGTGSSKSSVGSKAPTMAGEPGTQLGSAQHQELQNISVPSPPALTTHATEQVHTVSEVAGVNPLGQSAGMHFPETKKTSSTTPVPGSADKMEIDDSSNFFVVTMEDLFPEDTKKEDIEDPKIEAIDPKDADMIEFDRFVARGCLNKDNQDKSKIVKTAPEAQSVVGSQKKQLKMLPTVGKCSPIFAGAPATGKRTKTPVPRGRASSGIVAATNASVPNRAVGGKASTPATTGAHNAIQQQCITNSNGNGMPKSVSPGTGTSANNQANTLVNEASKGNPPASQ